jgi:methylated-DNA-[protein]-cysteine S-methyltransferase
MEEAGILSTGELKKTSLGTLWLAVSGQGLAAVWSGGMRREFETWLTLKFKRPLTYRPEMVACAAGELREYLLGSRTGFSQMIDWTLLRPFQCAVLQATVAIPYGQTRSYKDIALEIGHPSAARAVGRAEATNPMPLVIPCHRVIGCDGRLHGYGFGQGIPTKEWLLQLEGALIT